METRVSANGVLADGEELNRAHPDTFEIPDRVERIALDEGDYAKVKLDFDPGLTTRPDGRDPDPRFRNADSERFWVEIVSVARTGDKVVYSGRIDNDLQFVRSHGLDYNDVIAFEPRHVISIAPRVTRH